MSEEEGELERHNSDEAGVDGPSLRDSRRELVRFRDVTQIQLTEGIRYWGMWVEGVLVTMPSDYLYNQAQFTRLLFAQTGRLVARLTPSLWRAFLGELIRDAPLQHERKGGSAHPYPGNWNAYVECLERLRKADSLDDLARNGGRYESEGSVWFSAQELRAELERREITIRTRSEFYRLLTIHGGQRHAVNVRGVGCRNLWSLPWPPR